jgi:predicted transposase YdaD
VTNSTRKAGWIANIREQGWREGGQEGSREGRKEGRREGRSVVDPRVWCPPLADDDHHERRKRQNATRLHQQRAAP